MSRRKSRIPKKLLLLVISTCLAIVAAELLLRCCWHNPYRREEPDRVVRLRLQHANAHHRIDRSAIDAEHPVIDFRTNDRSYIEPSFQYVEPDCTIAFLGGSTTECCAVREELRFPTLVSSLLGERGYRVTTLNAGTSGNTVHDSINILLNHTYQDRPDYVVLMHACNDIGLLSEAGSYDLRAGRYMSWASAARSAAMKLTNYSSLAGLTRQVLREHTHFVPIAPAELEPRPQADRSSTIDGAFEQRLRGFVQLARSFGIQPILMTQPISSHFTELTPSWVDQDMQLRFNETVRRVGADVEVPVIDLVDHLEQHVPNWDRHLHLFYDGIHVTDEGSRVYGEHIAEVLCRRMESASLLTREASSSQSLSR